MTIGLLAKRAIYCLGFKLLCSGQIIRDNVHTLINAYNLVIGICLALVGAYANMAYLLIIVMNILIGIAQEIHKKKWLNRKTVLMLEPDYKRIKGKFLPNVLNRALPFAILILINVIIVLCISPALGISRAEATTAMYYVTGLAVLCIPVKSLLVRLVEKLFNKIRKSYVEYCNSNDWDNGIKDHFLSHTPILYKYPFYI